MLYELFTSNFVFYESGRLIHLFRVFQNLNINYNCHLYQYMLCILC